MGDRVEFRRSRVSVLNLVLVHIIGMFGTQVFWGANPRAPIGG